MFFFQTFINYIFLLCPEGGGGRAPGVGGGQCRRLAERNSVSDTLMPKMDTELYAVVTV